jgi:hypothetical protein
MISAGALSSDQTVTLQLISALAQQPPSGFVIGVGPGLVLSASSSFTTTSTGNIQFVISAGTNTAGLQESAAMVDLVDSNGDNFFGVTGGFDSTTNLASITVPSALMSGTSSVAVCMGNLAPPYNQSGATIKGALRARRGARPQRQRRLLSTHPPPAPALA